VGGILKEVEMACKSEKSDSSLIKRLNRIEGQVRGIKNMIEEDRGCLEVMTQILSVSSAIRSVWEILAAHHLHDCLSECEDINEKKDSINQILFQIKKLR